MQMTGFPVYRHGGALMLRASSAPDDLALPDPENLAAGRVEAEVGRVWLAETWRRPEVRSAVAWASPGFAEQLERIVTGGRVEDKDLHRAISALCFYLLRWRGRATPFGLFAGIAPARAGTGCTLRFGAGHRMVVRCDAQWIDSVVDRLETYPGLRARLRVVANNTAVLRGGRAVVAAPVPDDAPGIGPLTWNQLRVTEPVQAVLDHASVPIGVAQLAEKIRAQFPAASVEQIDALISGLIEKKYLITSLRVPAAVRDPLAHLVTALAEAGAGQSDEVAPLADGLTELAAAQVAHNAGYQNDRIRGRITARMRELHDPGFPLLAADLALDADLELPSAVLDEAGDAASLMVRLSPDPYGQQAWKRYQYQFRARYGPGALVPLAELLSDAGLGYPAGYLDSPRKRTPHEPSTRDNYLMNLVQRTWAEGSTGITLTEAMIEELTLGAPQEIIAPDRVELAVAIEAANTTEMASGRFRLWVTGAPRSQSSMAGRFAHLLDDADLARLAESFAPCDPQRRAVQLDYLPRRRDDINIAQCPKLLPDVIAVGTFPQDGTSSIRLDELAVSADATCMYLVHAPTGTVLEPRAIQSLEATLRTAPIARFLSEIASARQATYTIFDFGICSQLTHLPRITAGRTVLNPARWRLNADDLAGPGAGFAAWEQALEQWRTRWRVPGRVQVCQGDQRLPMDLEDPLHRSLLRQRLARVGKVELREHAVETGWAHGRAVEVLIALHATGTTPRERIHTATLHPPTPLRLPGHGEVLHARLTGHPDRLGQLAEQIPRLIEKTDASRAWFTRTRDTTWVGYDEHLSITLRLPSGTTNRDAASELTCWAEEMLAQHLLADLQLAPYRYQPGRWGAGAAEPAAEDVFAADSQAALRELALATAARIAPITITAASLVRIAAALAPDVRTGMQALVDLIPHIPGTERTWRAITLQFDDPAPRAKPGIVHRLPGGAEVIRAWGERAAALRTWREAVTGQREVLAALPSLLHEHTARVLGTDTETEQTAWQLARASALRTLHVEQAKADT